MSKIICDVCGTSYPDTASQCPICGYANSGSNQAVSGDTQDSVPAKEYTYVKGGRFSKSNVRKRNQAQGRAARPAPAREGRKAPAASSAARRAAAEKQPSRAPKSTTGLIITAVVLLLAIVAMVVYISIRYFGPDGSAQTPNTPNTPVVTVPMESTEPQAQKIPCTSVKVDVDSVVLDAEGVSRMIYATAEPENTTDVITFMSNNPQVATVSESGKITAVGPGSAVITVTCGTSMANIKVECTMAAPTEPETTAPETTAPETQPGQTLELNRKDITFAKKGDSWTLYNGNIGKTQIKWSSDDPKIATFEGGVVTAVGNGTTKVHAEYNGQKVSCIIRCNLGQSGGVEGNGGGIGEDGGNETPAQGGVKIYSMYGSPVSDVTMKTGETLGFSLQDASGKTVDATWSLSGSAATLDGSTVKAVSAGQATLTATYNGQTYTCIIRVN